jgi:hypothetical protein
MSLGNSGRPGVGVTEMPDRPRGGLLRAVHRRKSGGAGELAEAKPSLDDGVRVERYRVDALLEQPLGKIWVIAGPLAADADVLAPGPCKL